MTDKPYYTSEQIPIPTEFPDILLQFSKAAIRTQPADVLVWSAAYVSFSEFSLLTLPLFTSAVTFERWPMVKHRQSKNVSRDNVQKISGGF